MKLSTIQIQQKLDVYELHLQLPMSQLTAVQLNPKGGHFLKDNIACFDNSFFRISDKEASVSDCVILTVLSSDMLKCPLNTEFIR